MNVFKIKYVLPDCVGYSGDDDYTLFYFTGKFGIEIKNNSNESKRINIINDLSVLETHLARAYHGYRSYMGYIYPKKPEEIVVPESLLEGIYALCQKHDQKESQLQQASLELRTVKEDLELKLNSLLTLSSLRA